MRERVFDWIMHSRLQWELRMDAHYSTRVIVVEVDVVGGFKRGL